MGNARSSLDSLMYFRSWTAAEVAEVQETLRRRKATLSVDRATFGALIGIQNRDSVQVFDALDSDYDGLVDTFEVLLTLTLWSCASWEEKLGLLFRCYDFNRKGVLRFPELSLMVFTAARVLGRFADLPAWTADPNALKDAALSAFGGSQSGELASDTFSQWFGGSDAAQQLRDFVDASLSQEAPEAVEALVRERVRLLEYRVQELSQEVAQLRETATAVRGEDLPKGTDEQQQRSTALWEKLDGLFALLASAEEAQRSELQELADTLSREIASGGVAALLEPSTRSGHGRLVAEIDALERRARTYLEQARVALGELVELGGALEEDFSPEGLLPPLQTSSAADGEDSEVKSRRLRLLDREMRRRRGKQPVEAEPKEAFAAAERASQEDAAVSRVPTQLPHQEDAAVSRAPTQTSTSAGPAAESRVASRAAASGVASQTPTSAAQGAVSRLSQASSPHAAATQAKAAGGEEAAAGSGRGVEEANEGGQQDASPIVVAFAEFVPPESNDTLMLVLKPGDEIMALGQDGQGWWYGRMVATGQEGWFPPTYVQTKEEATKASAGAASKPSPVKERAKAARAAAKAAVLASA